MQHINTKNTGLVPMTNTSVLSLVEELKTVQQDPALKEAIFDPDLFVFHPKAFPFKTNFRMHTLFPISGADLHEASGEETSHMKWLGEHIEVLGIGSLEFDVIPADSFDEVPDIRFSASSALKIMATFDDEVGDFETQEKIVYHRAEPQGGSKIEDVLRKLEILEREAFRATQLSSRFFGIAESRECHLDECLDGNPTTCVGADSAFTGAVADLAWERGAKFRSMERRYLRAINAKIEGVLSSDLYREAVQLGLAPGVDI